MRGFLYTECALEYEKELLTTYKFNVMKKYTYLLPLFCFFTLASCSSSDSEDPETLPEEEQGQTLTEAEKEGLLWSEEFEGTTLNAATWTYDLGDGSQFGIPGWGNSELQSYTSSAENIEVANGFLKITAKKEAIDGKEYSSARIKTINKFDFKYGTLKIRAKFPTSKGTWPAFWLMGANQETVGWPDCGEIDLVEQTGQEKDKILGTVHWKNTEDNSNAKFSQEITSTGVGSDFKVYTLIWEETKIKMYVENVKYFEMTTSASMPFNQNFYLLTNVAMGGSLGGEVSDGFSSDDMIIDYIRLYEN